MLNIDRYETYRADGRLIRNLFTAVDGNGRELACWLAALSDPVAECGTADECPAEDMPQWLAQLIPHMDDQVSQGEWDGFARRLGAALRTQRTSQQWERARLAVVAVICREAMRHITDEDVAAVCERTANLCGGEVDEDTFSDVSKAAWRLRVSKGDGPSSWTAWSIVKAARPDAPNDAALEAAIDVGNLAKAGRDDSEADGVKAESWDRITDGVLKALEAADER